MKLNLRTPALALIVALSTVSVAATPNQAEAQNAFVIGQTYQTTTGNLVTFAGNDANGQPIFAPVVQRQQVYTNFGFSNRHRGFRRSHFRSHRNRGHRNRRHRNHRSSSHHKHHKQHHGH